MQSLILHPSYYFLDVTVYEVLPRVNWRIKKQPVPSLEVERPGAPPGKEKAKPDSVHQPGDRSNGNLAGVLGFSLRVSSGAEQPSEDAADAVAGPDEATSVHGTFVGKGSSGIENSREGVGLDTRPDERGAEDDGRFGRLARVEELGRGRRALGTLVDLTENRGENRGVNGLREDSAEGNGRRLNSGKVLDRHRFGISFRFSFLFLIKGFPGVFSFI